MSVIKQSTDALSANVFSQIIGIVCFLIIPNIITAGQYAVIVYVNLLIYYAGFTNLGLVYVHSRKAPGMLANGMEHELVVMEDSIMLLWLLLSFIYSVISGYILYTKYASLLFSITLAVIIILTPFGSFYIQKKTVRGSFRDYRNLTIFQSLLKFVTIIGTYLKGLNGWFIGTMVSMISFFACAKDMCSLNWKISPLLFKRNIPEGIMLVSMVMIWGTLLMLGRVQSVVIYSQDMIAQYGVITGCFQMIASAVIAVCLPVTVKIYSLCVGDRNELFWFVFKLQFIMTVGMTVFGIILADFIPFLFPLVFKKYSFQTQIIKYIMLSVVALPILTTCGSILIGYKKLIRYLIVLGFVLAASFCFIFIFNHTFNSLTAAVSQFIFLNIAAVGLLILIWYSFTKRNLMSMLIINIPIIVAIMIFVFSYILKYSLGALIHSVITSTVLADGVLSFLAMLTMLLVWSQRHLIDNYKDKYLKYAQII